MGRQIKLPSYQSEDIGNDIIQAPRVGIEPTDSRCGSASRRSHISLNSLILMLSLFIYFSYVNLSFYIKNNNLLFHVKGEKLFTIISIF